jgi:NhaP-type Na+/H+ or K+/H+ antiporter
VLPLHTFFVYICVIILTYISSNSKNSFRMKKILVFLAFFVSLVSFTYAQTTPQPTTKPAKTTKSLKSKKSTGKKAPISTAVKSSATTTAPAPAAAAAAPTGKGPIATFEKTEVDYGKIEQGSEPLRVFTFKNTGTEPLIISNAQGSCGCTVPTYPKEPIMPGQSSKIEVRYDTQRIGGFTKSVTLTTNEANNTRVLTIKGEVSAKPASEINAANAPKN